jgi:hypothetical protein
MADHAKSAAASIFPNLPHDDGRQADWTRRDRSDVASALYPEKQPPRQRSPESERLLRHLKELRQTIDARLSKQTSSST